MICVQALMYKIIALAFSVDRNTPWLNHHHIGDKLPNKYQAVYHCSVGNPFTT